LALLYTGGEMTYKVALHKTEEGYSVSCPGLPGCWSQGDSETEALDNIRSAIQEYVQGASQMNGNADIREVEVTV
jgi:predicted RNase H-like HicB family nuclease